MWLKRKRLGPVVELERGGGKTPWSRPPRPRRGRKRKLLLLSKEEGR